MDAYLRANPGMGISRLMYNTFKFIIIDKKGLMMTKNKKCRVMLCDTDEDDNSDIDESSVDDTSASDSR